MMRPIDRSGLTLLEILVATAIAAGVLTLATYFALDISNFGLFLGDRLGSERELEQAIRVFVTEVRSMGPSENGSYPIALADGTAFTFFADVDADGQFEQVRYFLNGTTLQKGVIDPTGIPATYPPASENVRDVVKYIVPGTAVFSYWNQSWIGETASLSLPAPVASVRLVRFRTTVDRDPAMPPLGITQSANITIRNLRGEI